MAITMQKTSDDRILRPKILGSGLCASAAALNWQNADIYSSLDTKKHTVVPSNWRPSPIVGNAGWQGLSRFYHGVLPSEILEVERYQQPLAVLGLSGLKPPIPARSYFVPRRVPRPKILKSKTIKPISECEVDTELSYLCMSVVGNISYLLAGGFLDEVELSDDIVFKVGEISTENMSDLLPDRQRTRQGCFFPCVHVDDIQLSFRPVFSREVTVNFIDIKENLREGLSALDLVEKARRASYLRYGFLLGKVKRWEVFAQKNISAAYIISRDGVFEREGIDRTITECREHIGDYSAKLNFSPLEVREGSVMSGIHLGYRREVLSHLPKNYRVLDTSLNNFPGTHPTIRSFCESYICANKDVQKWRDENFGG